MPGSVWSSMKLPLPCRKRGSSLRFMEWPMPQILAEVLGVCHQLSSPILAAAYSTALTMFTYPVQRQRFPEIASRISASLGFALACEQCGPGHQHAGGAEAALQAVLLLEALLQRGHAVGAGEAFHRADVGAVGLDGQDGARLGGHAVDQQGARAAVRGVAADMGAGEREFVADQVDEEQPGVDLARVRLAVHGDGDLVSGHVPTLLRAKAPCGWPCRSARGPCSSCIRPNRGGRRRDRWRRRRPARRPR